MEIRYAPPRNASAPRGRVAKALVDLISGIAHLNVTQSYFSLCHSYSAPAEAIAIYQTSHLEVERTKLASRRCPSCHKLFSSIEVKREQISGGTFQTSSSVFYLGGHAGSERARDFRFAKQVINYNVAYRCKSCNHEWVEAQKKEL